MSSALGTGWLIALIIAVPAFVTAVFIPAGRFAARLWSKIVAAQREDKRELRYALEAKSRDVVDLHKTLALCEIHKDMLISEVRLWRAGREPEESERFRL